MKNFLTIENVSFSRQ